MIFPAESDFLFCMDERHCSLTTVGKVYYIKRYKPAYLLKNIQVTRKPGWLVMFGSCYYRQANTVSKTNFNIFHVILVFGHVVEFAVSAAWRYSRDCYDSQMTSPSKASPLLQAIICYSSQVYAHATLYCWPSWWCSTENRSVINFWITICLLQKVLLQFWPHALITRKLL